jgi:hypothetical protein
MSGWLAIPEADSIELIRDETASNESRRFPVTWMPDEAPRNPPVEPVRASLKRPLTDYGICPDPPGGEGRRPETHRQGPRGSTTTPVPGARQPFDTQPG